jgi:hypothetical protein
MRLSEGTLVAVQKLDKIFPSFSADFTLAAAIDHKVGKHLPQDTFERAVVQQCSLAWRLYCAILILLSDGFGVSSAILTRSLFEYVVGVKYLIKNKGNRAILHGFHDYGLKTLYESMNAPLPELEPTYLKASSRFKKSEKWHRKGISELVKDVGLGNLLQTLYKLTSSVAHGDAMTSLLETGGAWQQVASSSNSHFSEISLEASYMLMSFLYRDVQRCLRLDCERVVVAMGLANKRRLEAFEASGKASASDTVQ